MSAKEKREALLLDLAREGYENHALIRAAVARLVDLLRKVAT